MATTRSTPLSAPPTARRPAVCEVADDCDASADRHPLGIDPALFPGWMPTFPD